MALKLLQPGCQPLGQFDGVDAETLTFKGGEVCSFASVATPGQPGVAASGFDQGAYDVFDGYVNAASLPSRAAISKTFTGATSGNTIFPAVGARPLFLADDGISGYGTLFGTVVGGTVGQTSYGPNSVVSAANLLGPSTATGSGKITCWDKPGLYAISLDAVDTTVGTTNGGLVPTNTSLSVGKALGFTAAGLVTQFTASQNVSTAAMGHFVEFNTNGSLVTTPNFLVAALNSPSGNVSSVGARQFAFATIYFAPPTT
jgi:hypothetical protein